MTLRGRLEKLRAERADIMSRLEHMRPRSGKRTIAQHHLTIITAGILATEIKLNRSRHDRARD